MIKRLVDAWVRQRFDVDKMRGPVEKQLKKPLPHNVGWFHTLGSMSLFLFLSQVVTGILLLVYYRPTVNEAFESVKFIMTKPYMGWLYRQVHAWGANLMVIVVFLHMLRTYITGSYKKPREVTWIFGVFLFIFTMIFGFTGYLLPWNQLAYWATTVGTEVAGSVPIVGEWIRTLMRGGPSVGSETLSRFFVIHVIILPWLLVLLVLIHLFLVRLQGVATMERVDEEKEVDKAHGTPFFPTHVLKEGIVFYILLGILITLAILAPFDLGEKADPLTTPHAIKPEWYFLPFYQVLKYFPKLAGIFVVTLAPIFLFLWPFLDRNKERDPRKRPFAVGFCILVLLSLFIFGVVGYLSETERQLFGKTYYFDVYGLPHAGTAAEHMAKLTDAEVK
ncbi:MAG: cytochrome bc complex cytochrome b subunit [Candidatus Omnitrophica bacterium CG11_big_fil_rev_8_21_14_0_20_45_26]|uniref:Cytochrome bc complex cytochrome b subunit n=1 Tax=Candidatus Abzuiibacterium crystallinum TaxID=1974748 RepID=A0A2H0LRG5_9BACT|nr:MAG: cytochrome bc complex cytochrome b subunit [Candidatus Omnitrophica bacterium CG11_big_fil_rev_8_21_14_0_20_45_26]PIW65702.1 MAG: cytochrome bc complex cytochrome b subunit [Candidatus Omnitrophica bacterium CG12_big_fil_rev_8_21_14_0_65_45_16]